MEKRCPPVVGCFRLIMSHFQGNYWLRLFISLAFSMSFLLITYWVHTRHRTQEQQHYKKSLPTEEEMDSMSHSELIDIYHNFMDTVTFRCKNIVRADSVGDGGWNVCADPEYIPKEPCLVYSFGIGKDPSFDLEILKKFKCEVHSFDPTSNDAQFRKISPLLNFHPIGLCDETKIIENRSYKSLYEIRKTLGHLWTELALLKIDFEMWEWCSLRHSISNNMLDDVQQLLVEFHPFNINKDWLRHQYYSSLCLLRDLQDLGFRAFSVQRNEFCSFLTGNNFHRTTCHNIHFVKIT